VRGGSHLSVFYVAKGLAEAGHEVHVFTTAPQSGSAVEAEKWVVPGVTRHNVFSVAHAATAWAMDRASVIMGSELRRYLSRETLGLQILHAYGMDTIPAVVMCRHYGHAVGTVNGYWATCPFWDHTWPLDGKMNPVCDFRHLGRCIAARDSNHNPLRRRLKQLFLFTSLRAHQRYLRRLELVLAISQAVRSILEANGLTRAQVAVCYNMIDPSDYAAVDPVYLYERFHIPRERRILLHAGRFAPYKGSNDILTAAPAILAEFPDSHFVFVGQGSGIAALRSRVEESRLGGRVTIGDFVDPRDMPHAYASAYATLHVATWPEPFARGPIEAMAAGTAVIATATGGTPEVVADGVTGLLIPPFQPPAIAAACRTLMVDPSLRQRLAKQGQELVRRNFTINTQIGSYVAAYESIL
jgi:glycosyltransferase involved in cell wall biosynthesis